MWWIKWILIKFKCLAWVDLFTTLLLTCTTWRDFNWGLNIYKHHLIQKLNPIGLSNYDILNSLLSLSLFPSMCNLHSNGRGRIIECNIPITMIELAYEAQVRFHIRVWVRVRVWDSAIFEKVGCGCGGVWRLKNY